MTLTKKATLLLSFIICFISCKKEYNSIGLNLEDELLGTAKDTTTITCHSVLYDTLNTTNLSNQLLGELHDPVFGKTTASVYSQFLTSGATPSFGEEPIIDSIVLTLQTASYYGDTAAAIRFSVFELSESLSNTDVYYSFSTSEHSNTNLLEQPNKNYYIRPNTPLYVNNEVLSPHLRIRLAPEFGQRLIDQSDNWLTDELLLTDFKGLYIYTESSHSIGCLFSCSMTSSLTGLIIYYHNTASTGLSYSFRPSSSGVTYNNYNHYGYADACQDLKRQILNNDSTNIRDVYLQAMGGVRTKISFPNIRKKFAAFDNRVVINRAELIITNCNPSDLVFRYPTNLSIQGVKSDGLYYIPDDGNLSSNDFFGGTYNATTGEYRIRITQYLQQLILNQGDYKDYCYLTIKGSGTHASRLVFYSSTPNPADESKQLKVEIAYTTY